MKIILSISFWFLLFSFVHGQQIQSFSSIDQHARKAPSKLNTIDSLTQYLIQPASNELEKARSIYVWVTHHIDYDNQAYSRGIKRINKNNQDVLRRKKAVCFGYSTLFHEMCSIAGLSSMIVSGYSKGTLTSTPDLSEADHAWNAIQVDSLWYLLDATWGSSLLNSSNDFVQTYNEDYFLTPPEYFILNHLPNDPMWQLLDCPINVDDYKKPADVILGKIKTREQCFGFKDSIAHFMALSPAKRKLQEAINTFRYNPTEKNKKQLGHAYLDYAGILSDEAELLQTRQKMDSLVLIYDKMIDACATAATYTTLYNWQQELYINALINHTISYTRTIPSMTEVQNVLSAYKLMHKNLLKAKDLLAQSPNTFFTMQAKEINTQLLEMVEKRLDGLKNLIRMERG